MSIAFKRSFSRVKDQLRDGARLMQMHTSKGLKWFVVPGGPVSDEIAESIIKEDDVQPGHDGLFRGINQSWGIK